MLGNLSYLNKAKPSVYAMAIDRPPSFSFPYLPQPPTTTLTSSLDTTLRLLYILLHANYTAMYRHAGAPCMYARYCMSQVRYSIILYSQTQGRLCPL